LINSSVFTLQPGDIFHDWHFGKSKKGINGTGDAGAASKPKPLIHFFPRFTETLD